MKRLVCILLILAGGLGSAVRASDDVTPAPASFAAPQNPLAIFTPYEREILGELIGSSRYWPKKVAVREGFDLDIIKDGEKAGTARIPAGTELDLVSVKMDGLVVAFGGSEKKLTFAQTDIVARYPQAKADAEKRAREEMANLAAHANADLTAQQAQDNVLTGDPAPPAQRPVVQYVQNVVGYGSPYAYYYPAPVIYTYQPIVYYGGWGNYCKPVAPIRPNWGRPGGNVSIRLR